MTFRVVVVVICAITYIVTIVWSNPVYALIADTDGVVPLLGAEVPPLGAGVPLLEAEIPNPGGIVPLATVTGLMAAFGVWEMISHMVVNISIEVPLPLPLNFSSILTLAPLYDVVEVENGLAYTFEQPDLCLGPYIVEPITSMETVIEQGWVCTTINNNTSYVFNPHTGGLIARYTPAEFAAGNWVANAIFEYGELGS
jgi:hypothetical protein